MKAFASILLLALTAASCSEVAHGVEPCEVRLQGWWQQRGYSKKFDFEAGTSEIGGIPSSRHPVEVTSCRADGATLMDGSTKYEVKFVRADLLVLTETPRGFTFPLRRILPGSDYEKLGAPYVVQEFESWEAKNLKTLEELCEKGDGEVCADLASVWLYGSAGQEDLAEAQKYSKTAYTLLRKSCDSGGPAACERLSALWLSAPKIVPGEHEADGYELRARELYLEQCQEKNWEACVELIPLLDEGEDPPNLERTRTAMEARCVEQEDKDACRYYVRLLSRGKGGPKNEGLADELAEKHGLDQVNDLRTCSPTDVYITTFSLDESQKAALDKACESGCMRACIELGGNWGDVFASPKWRLKARYYYQRACDGGFAEACERAAFWTGSYGDLSASRAFAERGCELGDPDACLDLGEKWKHGIGGPMDEEKSASLYEKAFSIVEQMCSVGRSISCDAIRRWLEYEGEVSPKSPRVRELWKLAHRELMANCERGDQDDCDLARAMRYVDAADRRACAARIKRECEMNELHELLRADGGVTPDSGTRE